MIVAAVAGSNNSQSARDLGVSVDTVRTWRMHWIGWQGVALDDVPMSERLKDVARPGRTPQITAEQTCGIDLDLGVKRKSGILASVYQGGIPFCKEALRRCKMQTASTACINGLPLPL